MLSSRNVPASFELLHLPQPQESHRAGLCCQLMAGATHHRCQCVAGFPPRQPHVLPGSLGRSWFLQAMMQLDGEEINKIQKGISVSGSGC